MLLEEQMLYDQGRDRFTASETERLTCRLRGSPSRVQLAITHARRALPAQLHPESAPNALSGGR